MILTLENTIGVGKRCKVFDAHGNHIEKVVWADTESGKVQQYALDEDGKYIVKGVIAERRWATYPAPLRVEWRGSL